MNDRPRSQSPFDDPSVRKEGEVPDIMAAFRQPPDDVGDYRTAVACGCAMRATKPTTVTIVS